MKLNELNQSVTKLTKNASKWAKPKNASKWTKLRCH